MASLEDKFNDKTGVANSDNEAYWRQRLSNQGQIKAAPERPLWRRFIDNVRHTIEEYGPAPIIADAIAPLVETGDGTTVAQRRQANAQRRRTSREDFQAVDPANSAGDYAADIGGSILGSIVSDPTNLIGGPAKTLGGKMFQAAGIGAGLDLAQQGAEVASGVREELSPEQAAVNLAASPIFAAGAHGAGRAWDRFGPKPKKGDAPRPSVDDEEPIDRRIRGLDDLANHPNTPKHEAEAARRMAAKLREKYGRPTQTTETAAPDAPTARDTGPLGLEDAANFGKKFGTVTSTKRSASKNKQVGGAKNSFHLTGRAMDIARKPGVSHKQIEAELRRAGYHIVESIDEGDHSHFAFDFNKGGEPKVASSHLEEWAPDELETQAIRQGQVPFITGDPDIDAQLSESMRQQILAEGDDNISAFPTNTDNPNVGFRAPHDPNRNLPDDIIDLPKQQRAAKVARAKKQVLDRIERIRTALDFVGENDRPFTLAEWREAREESGLDDVANGWINSKNPEFQEVGKLYAEALKLADNLEMGLGGGAKKNSAEKVTGPSDFPSYGLNKFINAENKRANDIMTREELDDMGSALVEEFHAGRLPEEDLRTELKEWADEGRKTGLLKGYDADDFVATHMNSATQDLSPSFASVQSRPGVNATRMAKMLGSGMYGDKSEMGPTAIKEVLQNSFDAIKTSLARGDIEKGSIDIRTDSDARTVTMTDNGVGMTPDILGGKFLEIAGSGKEEGESSGGFGIAKMMFLYDNDALKVTTMRDGQVATMSTDGATLFQSLEDPSVAPLIDVRPATEEDLNTFPAGHGTQIVIKFPEKFLDPATDELREIEFPYAPWQVTALTNSPLFAPIDVSWNGEKLSNIGSTFPHYDYKQFNKVQFPWGDADIYVTREPEKGRLYQDNVHFLSNGLWQFSQRMNKDPGDPWGERLPYTLYIDVHPDVKPEENGYPFMMNRQGLTKNAGKEFGNVLDYINKTYAHHNLTESSQNFGEIRYFNENGFLGQPQNLVPTVPQRSEGFASLEEGDNVVVRDGRLYVEGKELPALTPEQLKSAVPSHKELKVDPSMIDPNRVMVHDNSVVKPGEDDENGYGYDDAGWYIGEEEHDQRLPSLYKHMKDVFGQRFDEYLFDVGEHFKHLRDIVANIDPNKYGQLSKEAIGMSFDPSYLGVSIRVPFSGSFLNPIISKARTPREAGFEMVGTMLHEFAHHVSRGHDAKYVDELQALIAKVQADNVFDLRGFEDEMINILTRNQRILEYGNGLHKEGRVKTTGDRFKDGSRRPGEDEGVPAGLPEGSGAGEYGPSLSAVSGGSGGPTGTGGGTPPSGGSPVPLEETLNKLYTGTKAAKKATPKQKKAYHDERSKRVKEMLKRRKHMSGMAAHKAGKAELAGELPKIDLEPIRDQFDPAELDALADDIHASKKLHPLEQTTVIDAIDGLLDGKLPTPSELALIYRVYPQLVDSILSQRSFSEKAKSLLLAAYETPRGSMGSGDVSFTGRQGLMMISRPQWWKALMGQFKALGPFKGDEVLSDQTERIVQNPLYPYLKKLGIELMDVGHHGNRDEFAVRNLAEMKYSPTKHVVKASNRAYTYAANELRPQLAMDILEKHKAQGVDIDDEGYQKVLGEYLNTFTGRGKFTNKTIDRAMPFLNLLYFAPRFVLSTFKRFSPFLWGKMMRHPAIAKEAARDSGAYLLTLFALLGVADQAGFDVEWDIRSPTGLKIKHGNTTYDVGGGLIQTANLLAKLATRTKITGKGVEVDLTEGKFGQDTTTTIQDRFNRTKFHPMRAYFTDMLEGKNVVGEDFDILKDTLELFLPMYSVSLAEHVKEHGWDGAVAAIPMFGGVGVNTFKPPKEDKKQTAESKFKKDGKTGSLESRFSKKKDSQ